MLIVEDGSGVPGANTYVSVADHIAYAQLYGVVVTPEQAEVNLRRAMDYLEMQDLSGTPVDDDQDTHYPANNAYVNGKLIANDIVPKQARKAENEIALAIFEGNDPLAVQERAIKREKSVVGEIEYMDGAAASPVNPRIDIFIAPLLSEEDGFGIAFRISNGRCC